MQANNKLNLPVVRSSAIMDKASEYISSGFRMYEQANSCIALERIYHNEVVDTLFNLGYDEALELGSEWMQDCDYADRNTQH